MSEDTDFAALYRELGIDATCSLAELRGAWRRRVAKLHPDQGGSAEDTGRLQQLNQRYDAALDFHARYGRMPGASAPGQLAGMAAESPHPDAWRRADTAADEIPAAGFGRIPRYFVAIALLAVAVLGWRIAVGRGDVASPDTADHNAADIAGSANEHTGQIAAEAWTAAAQIVPGQGKDTVRNILGEPLDMHALRWTYGPSWVEFRCDKVAGWHSSPLRPLPLPSSAAQTARADAASTADDRCD